MKIDYEIKPEDLADDIQNFWELSAAKIVQIQNEYPKDQGTPVFTVHGKYTTRGWTEWTQGFLYGSAILQFDATGDEDMLRYGREQTIQRMAPHVTHFGVHDHGFNNLSTYGNLWRLMNEGRLPENEYERHFYELALKVSGAVQARRWANTADGDGYIYSFNGPQSLFADTIRSLRVLAVSHQLGHVLQGEQDRVISLLDRLIQHARSTARYIVYYGEGRDAYDQPGRVAHEAVFNTNNGVFRAPNSQQGFSPFSTWTRGLAWVMTGFAEQLEWLATRSDGELEAFGGRREIADCIRRTAVASSDFYIENTAADGIPYWDTGAPQLHRLGDYRERPAEPFNDFEPVDSSAAAIATQGLLRLGHTIHEPKYVQAGLTVLKALLRDPYISRSEKHQGLILHSVYHRPNGWDYVPTGARVPCGEASLWGDYHAREAAVYVQRMIHGGPRHRFFGP